MELFAKGRILGPLPISFSKDILVPKSVESIPCLWTGDDSEFYKNKLLPIDIDMKDMMRYMKKRQERQHISEK